MLLKTIQIREQLFSLSVLLLNIIEWEYIKKKSIILKLVLAEEKKKKRSIKDVKQT